MTIRLLPCQCCRTLFVEDVRKGISPLSPCSPYRVHATFASVPAPVAVPVVTFIVYVLAKASVARSMSRPPRTLTLNRRLAFGRQRRQIDRIYVRCDHLSRCELDRFSGMRVGELN